MLESFRNDPFQTSLRTHRLSGKLKDVWSYSVEYDLRVVFYFADTEKVVLIDVGTHDEVYKEVEG
jgi:toxin HigB-1